MPTASRKKPKAAKPKSQKAKRPGAARASSKDRAAKAPARTAAPKAATTAQPPSAKTAPSAKVAPGGKAGPTKAAAKPASPAAPASAPKPGKPQPRKGSRRSALSQRRGPDGELLAPGELLLPGGPQSAEEVAYLLRGSVAAEHGDAEAGIGEVMAKRPTPGDPLASRTDLARQGQTMDKRFSNGAIEPQLPSRGQASRRTFASVVERARMRRREIGAFLRGLHLGRTETSHMDSHGEASLQSLMEWAARLENLMEAEEPNQADYSQFHRGLDHLENTTEALMVDVEATLRRLRDKARSR